MYVHAQLTKTVSVGTTKCMIFTNLRNFIAMYHRTIFEAKIFRFSASFRDIAIG